ncbi:hypothetical protein O1611_g4734 [Lasiodiplodia mahajangana]|uniref:Uncharacterized protein n=1 Tax=Lasiodiplodia mahajangana TaxID=1108764 RepID=A0ACC2JNI3_9PEZI|nr:hypothetical protein O1611_g4734 [Lasiodiplodia mahajangana]
MKAETMTNWPSRSVVASGPTATIRPTPTEPGTDASILTSAEPVSTFGTGTDSTVAVPGAVCTTARIVEGSEGAISVRACPWSARLQDQSSEYETGLVRSGIRNECDETKPSCKKCDAFSVVCCYGSKFSPEGLLAKQSFRVHIGTTSPSVMQSPPAPLPVSGSRHSLETYQLVARDISLIERFQRRTVWTLGTGATHHVYAAKTLPLAFTNPLLMHAVLAMAEMHDLAMGPFGSRKPYSLTYHWYHAVSSMRQYLNNPIAPSECDLLWVSANLIGIGSLACVEERSPEEAWPLRPPSPADLSCLSLCGGQKLIAQLISPMTEDSAFYLPAMEMCNLSNWVSGLSTAETEGEERSTQWLPKEFEAFFGVSFSHSHSCTMSNDNNRRDDDGGLQYDQDNNINQDRTRGINNIQMNPYHAAVKAAVELFERELDEENFLMHVSFVRALDAPFRQLLIDKDEKAMLVLLYWYAKMCDRRVWWLWKKCCIEGLAICRYLERAWTAPVAEVGLSLLERPMMRLMAALQGTV